MREAGATPGQVPVSGRSCQVQVQVLYSAEAASNQRAMLARAESRWAPQCHASSTRLRGRGSYAADGRLQAEHYPWSSGRLFGEPASGRAELQGRPCGRRLGAGFGPLAAFRRGPGWPGCTASGRRGSPPLAGAPGGPLATLNLARGILLGARAPGAAQAPQVQVGGATALQMAAGFPPQISSWRRTWRGSGASGRRLSRQAALVVRRYYGTIWPFHWQA